jgi:NAD(P)-dependent dehydrogenase (short-subunit alcohol dehydrogenase family)
MRLKDKIAIITGAGSGLGRETAHVFVREGATVVVGELNEAAGRAVVGELEAAGGRALWVPTDVATGASVAALVAEAERAYGRVDVLFNNAGICPDADASVLDTPEDVFDQVIAVNLKGVFLGCKYGIPALRRAGGGSIINMASLVALMGSAVSQVAYTASKGGVLSMTRELAIEFAKENIRLNALCPGPVQTTLMAQILSTPERRQRRLVHVPKGRFAEPREIANAALFLASDESSYVNGATFVVDGGISAAYVTPE